MGEVMVAQQLQITFGKRKMRPAILLGTNLLTQEIIAYFRNREGWCIRQNAKGIFDPKHSIWGKGTTAKGAADMLGCSNGTLIAIVLKVGQDRLCKHQQTIQQAIERSGSIQIMAKYIAQVKADFRARLEGRQDGK